MFLAPVSLSVDLVTIVKLQHIGDVIESSGLNISFGVYQPKVSGRWDSKSFYGVSAGEKQRFSPPKCTSIATNGGQATATFNYGGHWFEINYAS